MSTFPWNSEAIKLAELPQTFDKLDMTSDNRTRAAVTDAAIKVSAHHHVQSPELGVS
ncbi:hypothetical protein H257_08084 [Aphanomyces astaci]|uniref:Uncharacterized protein n=1 Tax=Aphanomyces astaci TaxID=112090 RepID=W4GFY3_APHAT|nr:hypothetical protein H257_08084 [Aphanomyces astaci]ETV78587.1 hypothetical protein H257_08084 [Aphanomyces astaci]|eukprot:XP_009832168.1 hypothetical protein H257_08084 [Aphanomyces astaci]